MKAYLLPLLIIAFALAGSHCFAQTEVDAVILKNGSKILGTIIEQVPNKSLRIRMRDGSEYVYTFDEIEIIRKETAKGIRGEFSSESYPELGANFGTPAGLNIAMGYRFGLVGLRLSGMYWGDDLVGAQANVGFRLSENDTRSHVIAVLLGGFGVRANHRYREWNYFGAAYELNLSGFFLQAGASIGDGDFSNPQLLLQIGYMYRFLPE